MCLQYLGASRPAWLSELYGKEEGKHTIKSGSAGLPEIKIEKEFVKDCFFCAYS